MRAIHEVASGDMLRLCMLAYVVERVSVQEGLGCFSAKQSFLCDA